MTECARCGDCCDPVTVTFDPRVYAREQLDSGDEMPEWARYQYQFFLAHWWSIGVYVDEDDHDVVIAHKVRCDQFDTVKRLCMAQDAKPDVCAGFPWYGRPPEDVEGRSVVAASLSPRCSFNADVPGRQMLPIVEVRHA